MRVLPTIGLSLQVEDMIPNEQCTIIHTWTQDGVKQWPLMLVTLKITVYTMITTILLCAIPKYIEKDVHMT